MSTDGIPVLWITINSFDFQSLLELIFTSIRYEINDVNISLKNLRK